MVGNYLPIGAAIVISRCDVDLEKGSQPSQLPEPSQPTTVETTSTLRVIGAGRSTKITKHVTVGGSLRSL